MTMTPGGSSLWPDLPLGTVSANVSSSYSRLFGMAKAWLMSGPSLTGDAPVLADLVTSLDHLNTNAYTRWAGDLRQLVGLADRPQLLLHPGSMWTDPSSSTA